MSDEKVGGCGCLVAVSIGILLWMLILAFLGRLIPQVVQMVLSL